MHPVAEHLLEQHVEYELDALTGKGLQPFLRAELRHLFEVADTLTLSDYATERRCVAAFKRLLVKRKIPKSAAEFAVSLVLRVAARLEDAAVDLQAVIGRERFLEFVDLTSGLHDYRSRMITELFQHPLYSDLISSLVYKALVAYLVDDNPMSGRVPGLGSVLKLGREVANRAVPDLDARVEKQLRNYIRGYLPALIRASEQFMDNALADETFLKRLAEAWPAMRSQQLTGLIEGLTSDDLEQFGDWSMRYWDELRRSKYFMDMGETLIAHVYQQYGDEPLAVLLGDLGITRSLVSDEVLAFAPTLARRLRESGYLADLLRRRLEPFYTSDRVNKILSAAPPS
jgi:hypothetical protein